MHLRPKPHNPRSAFEEQTGIPLDRREPEKAAAACAPLTPAEETQLIERATNAALDAGCALIQSALGVTAGDLAGLHFSGSGADAVRRVLSEYLEAEKLAAQEASGHAVTRCLASPTGKHGQSTRDGGWWCTWCSEELGPNHPLATQADPEENQP